MPVSSQAAFRSANLPVLAWLPMAACFKPCPTHTIPLPTAWRAARVRTLTSNAATVVLAVLASPMSWRISRGPHYLPDKVVIISDEDEERGFIA